MDTETVPVEVNHTVEIPVAEPVEAAPIAPEVEVELIRADVDIVAQEQQTERAAIEARAAVRIAEAANEEPIWLADLKASLARMEEAITALATATIIQAAEPSTPQPSVTVVTEPTAPVVTEPVVAGEENAVAMPESHAVAAPAEVPAEAPVIPVRRPRRWT